MRNNISNNINNNSYLFFFNEPSTLYKNSTSYDKKNFPALNKDKSLVKKFQDDTISNSQDENKNLFEEKLSSEHFQNLQSTHHDTLMKNPLDSYHLVNCRSVTDFEKIEEIGEGTYGKVCKFF